MITFTNLHKYKIDFTAVLFFSLIVFANPLTAEAYIDPGTGSIIVQAIIASMAVVGFYLRTILGKVLDLFRFFSSKDSKNKEDNTETDSIK